MGLVVLVLALLAGCTMGTLTTVDRAIPAVDGGVGRVVDPAVDDTVDIAGDIDAGVDARVDAAIAGPTGPALDPDGVAMLYPSAPGSSLRLGNRDPNTTSGFQIENRMTAIARTEGAWHYFTTAAFDFTYTEGNVPGKTSRLHLHASGGTQQYTWKTQQGYLANSADLRNQELTVYARLRGLFDASRAAITLKVRGGEHMEESPAKASCVMFRLALGADTLWFGKELDHPLYDYVHLVSAVPFSLEANRWYGFKMVSFQTAPGHVLNRLYVDRDPFDAAGKPRNGWVLLGQYEDVQGKSTGQYSQVVNWGGWESTVRVDGVTSFDFALPSAREIAPPG